MRVPAFRSARPAALLAAAAFALAGCASVSLDEPIETQTWRLVSLYGSPVAVGTDPQAEPQVSFNNGQVSGSGGCNRVSGSYQRTGTTLKIGPLASTRRACIDAGRTQVETQFLAALQGTTRYTLAGGELVLIDGNGQTLARLTSGAR